MPARRGIGAAVLVACGGPLAPAPTPSAVVPPPAPLTTASASNAPAPPPPPAPTDPDEGKGIALGGEIRAGDWGVTFKDREGGLAKLEAKHWGSVVETWRPSDDRDHEVKAANGLFALRVTFHAIHTTTIELTLDEVDHAIAARYGEQHKMPGLYKFPDGVRLVVEQSAGCDFDPSDPCPFGGTYRFTVWVPSEGTGGPMPAHSLHHGALNRRMEIGRRSLVPGLRVFVMRKS